ncbi:FcoT family thioesterase [Mycolicibacterium helvum]|uniref:(2E)-enoyl-[ACP] glycyltransferase n=1 Tax=Mycolicibacterium helvum TaxID=1534349 RepID=A0A7I7TAT0_9MYCO|nr:FcoT family thioesterase [Mycolicibacterium helvum]BBY65591.1 hypothetical protein MHEL_38340 [Mycolicibacterium helvum]
MSTAGVISVEDEREETSPIPEDLLVKVLKPYSDKGCRYLLDAQYKATDDSVLAFGNFCIPDSSYITSTGHFNAADLLICFNQLAYSAFAPAIVNEEIPVLVGWSIEDYFDYQLPSMLIKNTASRFRRPINAHKFSARLMCQNFEIIERTWRYLKVPCTIECWDDDGGAASGQVELAALNIP